MKRTTIKSLTIEANEFESADYMDVLLRDVYNGNYSQLRGRLFSMSKKELLQVIDRITWDFFNEEGSRELMKVHKYAINAMEDKL